MLALAVVAIVVYAVSQHNQQVTGAAVSPISYPSLPPPAKVGTPAPHFEIAVKGGVISSQLFAGKPYMIELFATWCPHCQRMTAVLRDLRRQFPPSRLGMVSVTASPISNESTPDHLVPENQKDVDTFEAAYGVTWPTAFDKDLTVAKAFGLNGYPGIFIVDARGTIRFTHSGEVDKKTLVDELRKAGA